MSLLRVFLRKRLKAPPRAANYYPYIFQTTKRMAHYYHVVSIYPQTKVCWQIISDPIHALYNDLLNCHTHVSKRSVFPSIPFRIITRLNFIVSSLSPIMINCDRISAGCSNWPSTQNLLDIALEVARIQNAKEVPGLRGSYNSPLLGLVSATDKH